MEKISVIGSGFAGLSAAATMASKGFHVDVYEKNDTIGGRARQFEAEGFVFDMGPSWYWMPDVLEQFFERMGRSSNEFYKLILLSPSFRIYFGKKDIIDIPSDFQDLCKLFESIEPGSRNQLQKFMKGAAFKYETGINKLVYKPGLSFKEYLDKDFLTGIFRLDVFSSFSNHVRKHFKDPRLIAIMEFPVLFLGAKPEDTPALYSLMNYAGLKLGTWYPMGGFFKIIEGMKKVCEDKGVNFYTNSGVNSFNIDNGRITHLLIKNDKSIKTDGVIASADYHHVEQKILSPSHRTYSDQYWSSRILAPSALIFYLGVNKKINNLIHHNLFFDEDFEKHSREIYDSPQWPSKPLFYVCCPSKTDPSVAPEGKENLFILIPIAPGLKDEESVREKYFKLVMERLENITGENIVSEIVYKKSYCLNDFIKDYHSFKGNAYGLANTLYQTAFFKPSLKSKKVKNLFYAGQLTVPGPGVPPSVISGQVAANELLKIMKN